MSSPSGEAPGRSNATGTGRPRVLVLGGGFAGVGAARKLNMAEVDVSLVDRNNLHDRLGATA